jgi:hypothetical protein
VPLKIRNAAKSMFSGAKALVESEAIDAGTEVPAYQMPLTFTIF